MWMTIQIIVLPKSNHVDFVPHYVAGFTQVIFTFEVDGLLSLGQMIVMNFLIFVVMCFY